MLVYYTYVNTRIELIRWSFLTFRKHRKRIPTTRYEDTQLLQAHRVMLEKSKHTITTYYLIRC